MRLALAAALLLSSTPVVADEYQAGYSSSKTCYRSEYREEYVPGTEDSPGYVRSWKETIEFPCDGNRTTTSRTRVETYREHDTNDCTDGKIAGGILGGGIGAALSQGDGRWWAIPLGVVGGSMIGCDIDGG